MNAPDHATTRQALQTPDIAGLMQALGQQAKVASAHMKRAQAAIKNRALAGLAAFVRHSVATPLVDRLDLNAKDIETVVLACSYVGGHRKISLCA